MNRLTREADLAAELDMPREQLQQLRRLHGWAHVRFSHKDIRYTDAQLDQIIRDMTVAGKPVKKSDAGQTARSARRAS